VKVPFTANAAPIDKVSQDLTTPPSLYVFNAAVITKPHAIESLTAEMSGYNLDVAVITETHLKTRHTDGSVAMTGFKLFRRDRGGRRVCGVCQMSSAVTGVDLWSQ